MKISIDTKEDSQEEIRKVIAMLQNIVGDSQQIYSNQPISNSAFSEQEASGSPFGNIFGDSSSSASTVSPDSSITPQENSQGADTEEKEESSTSTDDLFAELFSEEELKKMEPVKEPEDGDEEELNSKLKSKSKRPEIEFY